MLVFCHFISAHFISCSFGNHNLSWWCHLASDLLCNMVKRHVQENTELVVFLLAPLRPRNLKKRILKRGGLSPNIFPLFVIFCKRINKNLKVLFQKRGVEIAPQKNLCLPPSPPPPKKKVYVPIHLIHAMCKYVRHSL